MKQLDRLILRAFAGPFLLTFAIVEFILLMQYMLKYVEDLVGKDLGPWVIAQLLAYFALLMVPMALPLAVLLSSLMTFGNLGEHRELTAIKSAGISLIRILMPVGLVAVVLTVGAFLFNNYGVPRAALKAYSLMWDARQQKLALDIRENVFYYGLPGYVLKVGHKYPDGTSLGNLMIYDHRSGRGNTTVILADSGRMEMLYGGQYLRMTLFRGEAFIDQADGTVRNANAGFVRQAFAKNQITFSLASFKLDRTKEELFAQNRMMKSTPELLSTTDSLRRQARREKARVTMALDPFYTNVRLPLDSAAVGPYPRRRAADSVARQAARLAVPATALKPLQERDVQAATNVARNVAAYLGSTRERLAFTVREANSWEVEFWNKYAQAMAVFTMFLIGAPLGSIIKKGGLGVPVLLSIVFFIFYYVISLSGLKWGRESVLPVPVGMWLSNAILLPIGLFFLYQARRDSSVLEVNFWSGLVQKVAGLRRRGAAPVKVE